MRGLVLAGGKSSRFGEDKALAAYEGTNLLERAVGLLDQMNLRPVVVTRDGAAYSFLSCTVIPDKVPDKGPLGGIYTAMSVFKGTDFLAITCDMPLLNPMLLAALFSGYHEGNQTTVFQMGTDRFNPFQVFTPRLFSTS